MAEKIIFKKWIPACAGMTMGIATSSRSGTPRNDKEPCHGDGRAKQKIIREILLCEVLLRSTSLRNPSTGLRTGLRLELVVSR